jgi:hypothetical protein
MAEDLSARAEDSMWPTSQGGGNMRSSNKRAMTAPGGMSVTPMPSIGVQEDPEVEMIDCDPRQLEHEGASSGSPGRWDDVSGRRESWGP